MSDLVSIITPTYNSEKFIEETIDAIKQQTFSNWELLITDDCSTDKTWDIISTYAEHDHRIKIFMLEKNQGSGISRNNSIKKAKGRFIAFCDSDDIWLPSKLEKQVSFMMRNNLAFSYTAYQKMNEDGSLRGQIFPPKQLSFKDLLKVNHIGCLTVIYDTKYIGKMYMPSIRKRQDYALWLDIHKKIKLSKGIVREVLAYYRVRQNSVSSNKINAALYYLRVLKSHGDVNIVQLFYYFIFYAISGLKKYYK